MKKGNKITLIILCSILALCVVSIAGVLVWRNTATKTPVSEEVVVENGKASAASETALRELLLKEEEINITLTEDVTVDKTLIVNGKKTLSGTGSIQMALYVMPYEYLLTIADNASLTLDGVTVNGNGIANGVKVEKNADLTLLSGEVAWGNPYGIEVQGNAEIKGGTITDAIHTGVFVGTSGHVEMNAGTIKSAGYASTRISVGGYLCLSDDAILQNCGVYHIHNAGTCDVKGGVVRDSEFSLATTEGDLNIQYQGTDGGMIEWYGATGSGIYIGEGGNLNASGFYVHDVIYAGVNSGQGTGSIKLTDCKFENTGNNGLHLKMAEVELKNVEIIKPGKHGVFINSPTTVATIENLTVTEPAERGLHNAGGKVTAKNVTVTNPGTYGVSAGNNGDTVGSTIVENLTVTGAGSNPDNSQPAVNCYKSSLVVNGATLTSSNNAGARVTDGGQLTLKNVKIDTAKGYGIYVLHNNSKAAIENVSVANTGKHGVYVNNGGAKADISNLTVTNAGERGIHNAGGTITAKNVTISNPKLYGVSTGSHTDSKTKKTTAGSVTIDNLTVTGAQGDAAVNSYKSVLTITNGKITDSAKVGARVTDGGTLKLTDVEVTKTGYEGVFVNSAGQAVLKNITVTNAGKHGVYVYRANSKADIDTLMVVEPTERGIHNAGGTITAKNVTIKDSGLYGVSTGNYVDENTGVNTAGSVTINNLTVTGAKGDAAVNSYKSVLTITNGKIKDSAKVAARVTDAGKLTLTDVEIGATKAGYEGVLVTSKGHAALKNITVTNAGKHGVYVKDAGSSADIDTLTVTKPTERGLHNAGGIITAKNVTVTSPGTYGVSTGNSGESKGSVTVTNLTVTDAGAIPVINADGSKTIQPAVNSYNSVLTVVDAKLIDSNGIGARATDGGELNLNNVEITNAMSGIYVSAGTVNAENATITSPSTYGVEIRDDGVAEIHNLEVTGAKGTATVYSNASVVTVNGGTIANSKGHGALINYGGTMTLNGVTIDGTASGKNAVNLDGDSGASKAYLTNLTVTDTGKYGVLAYGKDGYVEINGLKVAIDQNKETKAKYSSLRGLCNNGAEIIATNVNIDSAKDQGISSWPYTKDGQIVSNGEMTIDGLVVTNSQTTSAHVNNSIVTVNTMTLTDFVTNGVEVKAGGTLNLKNASIDGTGTYGAYVEGTNSTLNINGTSSIKNANTASVFVEQKSIANINVKRDEGSQKYIDLDATENSLTITNTKSGIYATSGTVNAANVTITSPSTYGVEIRNSGVAEIHNLKVTEAKGNAAVYSNNSVLTVVDGTLTDSKKDGALVNYGGTLNLTDVDIDTTVRHGVYVDGATGASVGNLTRVEITDAGERSVYNVGGTLTGSDVTVNSSGSYAVSLGSNATGKITNLTVNGTDSSAGVMSHASNLTIDGTTTIADTKSNGAVAAGEGSLILKGTVNINNAGGNGVQVEKNCTAEISGVAITGAKKHGIYNEGGTTTGENITITSPEIYAAYTIKKDDVEGSVTLTGLNVTGAKVNVPSEDATTVDGALFADSSTLTVTGTDTAKTIESSNKNGAGVRNGGTLNLTNIAITNAKRHGVYVAVGSTATLNGLTVTDCAERGLYVVGGKATGNNVTTNSTGLYGISAGASGSTRAEIKITGLTVNGTDKNSGIMAHNSDVTINGGTITGTKTDGVTAASAGVANLTDVGISNTGRDGVRVEKNSTANLTRVTFSNCAAKETYKTETSATINVLE